jgi:hypothetical protein
MDEDGLLALGRYGAGSAGWRSPLRRGVGWLALAATGRDGWLALAATGRDGLLALAATGGN